MSEEILPKVVILLAAYNGVEWIDAQIKSICRQKDVDIDLIISVDESTDGTYDFLCSMAKECKNIILLPYGNSFGSAVSNFMYLFSEVDFTSYDYIGLSDQDDIWFDWKVSRAISSLRRSRADGYSSDVLAFWPNGKQKLIKKSQPQVSWDYLFEGGGPGCTYLLTKRVAIDLQNFIRLNKRGLCALWLHDWFIYAFVRAKNFTWYIDEIPTMLYRQHKTNTVGVNVGLRALIYRFNFVIGGRAFLQSSLIAKILDLQNIKIFKCFNYPSRKNFLYLAFNSCQCRRRQSEKIAFFFFCLILFVMGVK